MQIRNQFPHHRPVIFESENVAALFDSKDSEYPIGIATDYAKGDPDWVSRREALELADAIQDALGNGRKPLVGAPLASQISFNEALMRLAAVHGKTVTFRYAKGDGAVIETRTLEPSEVKEVGGHVTFSGYDPDRDEPRAYRVDRMKGEVSIA